jgi:phosphohistidine phosphatase
MKQLLLLRHAKSSWDDPDLADHERPLAPRGRRASEAMAHHLRREGVTPRLVLCSSSRRTRETLDRIASAWDDEVETRVEPDLYAASEADLLARLREVPDEVASVLLIGHQPAVGELAVGLARNGREVRRARRKFPTAALATLEFEGTWHDLAPGSAEMVGFVRPKDLDGSPA